MTKNYLLLLYTVIVLSCKKAPDLNPNTIRLTKVETFGFPNGNTTFDYLVAHTDEFKPNTTNEYIYDSQARPVEMRLLVDGQLSHTYKAEYTNGRISRMTSKAANEYVTEFNASTTFTWAGDSVIANEVYANGTIINSRYEFNANKLPIRKAWRRTNFKPVVDHSVIYDEYGNVKTLDISGITEEYEYDLSKFNPYTSSYEMRWFTIFSNFDFQLIPFETSISTNCVTRVKRNQTWYNSSEAILETNPIGYATKISYPYPKSVKLFYYN